MLPILIILAVAVLLSMAILFNALVRSKNKVDEAFATMDVYLKKRFELVPSIVASVKAYAKHEADTLQSLTSQRSKAQGLNEKVEIEERLSDTLRNLMVSVERYPDLKASNNFLALQHELHCIEEDIMNARRYYNGSVCQYNNKVDMFPSNLIASIFRFQRKPMFVVSEASERDVPNTTL